jgi:hypothetical protein
MKAFMSAALGPAIACCTFVVCNAASVADLQNAIEGVYILDQWNINGATFRPPQVKSKAAQFT